MLQQTLASSRFLVGACLTVSTLVGCAGDAQQAPEDFAVTSNVEQGLLARIDYQDGSHVDFLNADDSVFITAVFNKQSPNPLRGIHLSEVLPSELFTYLTGETAPESLLSTEAKAGLESNPEAFASLEPTAAEGDLGKSVQAETAEEFTAQFCNFVDFCGTDIGGARTIGSPGRVHAVEGAIDVHSGKLRLRVRANQPIGGDKTLVTLEMKPEVGLLQYGGSQHGIDRSMKVIIDNVIGFSNYHLSANYRE